MMVMRVGSIDRVAQHHDELGVGRQAGDSPWNARVKEIVGTGFARERPVAVQTGSRDTAGIELRLIPLPAAVEVEIEIMDLLCRRRQNPSMRSEVAVQRRGAGSL